MIVLHRYNEPSVDYHAERSRHRGKDDQAEPLVSRKRHAQGWACLQGVRVACA